MNRFARTLPRLGAALLLALAPLRADDAPAPSAAPVTDPALVAQRYQQIAAQPRFHEVEKSGINPRLEDLLTQWFKQFGAKVGDFKYSSRMPAFESMLMSLLVVFSIGVLIYITYRITRGRAWTWDESRPSEPGEKELLAPEFYDEEIAQAIRAQDWHAAWLAAWRQFLSRLEQRNLVEADRTRTNREYLGQLRGRPLPAPGLAVVTAMVNAYDRFIYGRAAIGEAEWNSFHEQIEQAALLLHLDDKRTQARGATA
jgi:hypothetical protein